MRCASLRVGPARLLNTRANSCDLCAIHISMHPLTQMRPTGPPPRPQANNLPAKIRARKNKFDKYIHKRGQVVNTNRREVAENVRCPCPANRARPRV